MTESPKRLRAALAGLLAVAALASAAPAQADAGAQDCDARLDRLLAQFYDMADRRSYEEAAEWWAPRWQAYFQGCVIH